MNGSLHSASVLALWTPRHTDSYACLGLNISFWDLNCFLWDLFSCVFCRGLWQVKYWAHCFISWSTRLAMHFHFLDMSLNHKFHFNHNQVSPEKLKSVSYIRQKCYKCMGNLNNNEKKSCCALLHSLCGNTRWSSRCFAKQCILFFLLLRLWRPFKLGTQKELAAVFRVRSAETSWSDLKNLHGMGAFVYANIGTYRRKVIYGRLNDADLWRFFCLLIVFILLAL